MTVTFEAVPDYSALSIDDLLKVIKRSMGGISHHRVQINKEMRKRLLPVIEELRRRTYRKQPGFYQMLAQIGFNADTVRQWFYRSHTADQLITLMEEQNTHSALGATTTTSPVPPDINVIAAELIRDLESDARKSKLNEVAQLANRLNPTIRKNLIIALEHAAKESAAFAEQLSTDFQELPPDGKCHQRVIREQLAQQPEADIAEKKRLAADFTSAAVREISYDEAKNVILSYEWLGNMGTTEFSFGLFFGAHLAGVACYGRTGGANVAASVCGAEHSDKVVTLCRGACAHWAHPHSASFLISEACRQMTKKGCNVFIAYSDPEAGEIGTIYQASNWLYCGMTNPAEKYKTPDGKLHDSRQVHCLTRDRTGGTLTYKRTRAEQKQLLKEQGCEFFTDSVRKLRQLLKEQGCEFFTDSVRKLRYVGIYGDRRTKRILRRALRWPVMLYPKRQPSVTIEAPQPEQKQRSA